MQLVCSASNSTTETLHGHISAKFTRMPSVTIRWDQDGDWLLSNFNGPIIVKNSKKNNKKNKTIRKKDKTSNSISNSNSNSSFRSSWSAPRWLLCYNFFQTRISCFLQVFLHMSTLDPRSIVRRMEARMRARSRAGRVWATRQATTTRVGMCQMWHMQPPAEQDVQNVPEDMGQRQRQVSGHRRKVPVTSKCTRDTPRQRPWNDQQRRRRKQSRGQRRLSKLRRWQDWRKKSSPT